VSADPEKKAIAVAIVQAVAGLLTIIGGLALLAIILGQ